MQAERIVHQVNGDDLLMREEIVLDGKLCAIILFASFDEPGIHFFSYRPIWHSNWVQCHIRQVGSFQPTQIIR